MPTVPATWCHNLRTFAAHCCRFAKPAHYLLFPVDARSLSDWAHAASRDGWQVFVRHNTGTCLAHMWVCYQDASDQPRIDMHLTAGTAQALLERLQSIHRDATGAF